RKTKPPALLVSVPSSLNPPFNMEIESVTSASIKGEFFNRIRPLELPLPLITGNDRSPMLPSYWNQKWEMGIVISVKETT
ncbi:hypothetical protein WG622_18320, partial [Cognatishimia sp. D5M38]